MSRTGVVLTSVGGALVVARLFAWLAWNYVLSPVNRVFIAMLLGIGDVGGQ